MLLRLAEALAPGARAVTHPRPKGAQGGAPAPGPEADRAQGAQLSARRGGRPRHQDDRACSVKPLDRLPKRFVGEARIHQLARALQTLLRDYDIQLTPQHLNDIHETFPSPYDE